MPASVFDTYVMVDWSAASVPRLGADSIWVAVLRRGHRGIETVMLENLATRHDALAVLRGYFIGALARGERVLAGFDFPFAYPSGLAARLGLSGAPWRAIWNEITALVRDDSENRNNRFAAAAELNRRLTESAYPFWGCPAAAATPTLQPRHHRRHSADEFPEHRLVEQRMRGPQPAWKLAGTGSAGGQALMGIPVLRALRDDPELNHRFSVWPFETGLVAATPARHPRVVMAEVYPSMVSAPKRGGEVKDKAQVRSLAHHFATLDARGVLGPLFAGDLALSPDERRRVEQEEGWVLGVAGDVVRRAPAKAPRYRYLRDPETIYRRSFALVRRAVDLSSVQEELQPLSLRLVHASGDPALIAELRASPGAIAHGRAALAAGASILVDTEMVSAGIMREQLPRKTRVRCALGDRRVAALARRLRTTRSAAAVELWRPHLEGAVVAIGNAPTALFHLLKLIGSGAPKPALVLGFPVGFVGAAESKAALAGNPFGLAYVTLLGRRGGSALAAAAVNALAGAPS
ncbi:MAG TPA: precorrin-8X methylmutase [Stellaceae bacterium]|nr:precorrin-8X methylmutase [Stellaceae bacterium]